MNGQRWKSRSECSWETEGLNESSEIGTNVCKERKREEMERKQDVAALDVDGSSRVTPSLYIYSPPNASSPRRKEPEHVLGSATLLFQYNGSSSIVMAICRVGCEPMVESGLLHSIAPPIRSSSTANHC